jgi:hypothetical protein
MQPGDTCYFRDGVYPGRYGEQNAGSNFNFGSRAPSGNKNNEIAFISYPGETVRFEATTDVVNNFAFGYPKDYYVIAGFTMNATADCIAITGANNRIIGNRCTGCKDHAYAIIHSYGDSGSKVYGNELFGASSGNKLDHPLYVSLGTDNFDFGWNYIHDNNIAEGPAISINTDNAMKDHYVFENIRIHDSTIDCRSPGNQRAIGIVATDTGSSVYIYNNVIVGGGGEYCIYQYSASSFIYNNTLYHSRGKSALYVGIVDDRENHYRPEAVDIRNNILSAENGCSYLTIDRSDQCGAITVRSNCYYGNGKGPVQDTHPINDDPLVINAAAGNFRLRSNSPCINAGDVVSLPSNTDIFGVARPQGGKIDIGACEFVAGGTVADDDQAAANTFLASENEIGGAVRVLGSRSGRGTVNPGKGEAARILFQGNAVGKFEIHIFSLTGEHIWETSVNDVREGMVEWSPKNIASGIYIVSVIGPGVKENKKIVILQ